MRAVVVNRHGGPDVLEITEVPAPQAGPGQLLVEVAVIGVNYMDIYAREGRPPYAGNLPFTPGAEGAGTVLAVGMGVEDFAAGDRVAWAAAPGSYAEQVMVPVGNAVAVPEGVDLTVAAAVMLQGMTAHYLCHSTYPVGQQDPVVVHAAAGGVGLLLTQLIAMRGGVIIATTSATSKAVLAQQAGAQYVAGYEDFATVVRQVTDGTGAAAVFDGVGQATFEASLAALRPRGYLVLYGAASGPVPPFDLQRLAPAGSLFVTRPTLGNYLATREELMWRAGDLFSWIREGRLSVRVSGTYPLDQAALAHEHLASRRTTGKLLLIPAGSAA
ncbi:MAG TPA: quinone oxidoreductase [Streptosporangiaceae bacterium]|nr:quinone oxidoreductase [Streptosporangiaceae bacterium]